MWLAVGCCPLCGNEFEIASAIVRAFASQAYRRKLRECKRSGFAKDICWQPRSTLPVRNLAGRWDYLSPGVSH